jgi:MFS family permease
MWRLVIKTEPVSVNRVLIPLGIGLALSLFGDTTLYLVLPDADVAAQAGVTLGMVGVLLGLNRLARVLFNGPVGTLYDRLPRRGLMIASISIGAASTALYALGQGAPLLVLGRVLWGLGWSGMWIGANTIALDISTEENRGGINGKLQMWFFIGVAVSSVAGGLLTDIFGYRGGLWVSAGLTAMAALMWLFLLPETRPEDPSRQSTDDSDNLQPDPFPWKVSLAVAMPYFMLRIVFAGVMASTTIVWLKQFVIHGVTLGGILIPLASLTGGFVALRVLVSVVSAPLSGRLSDWLGRRWAVMAAILMLGALGLWIMSFPIFVPSLLGAFLGYFTTGGIPALAPAIIGDHAGVDNRGRALSLVFTIGDLGSAIGPPMALGLIPLIGVGGVYELCALLFGLAGIFAIWQALLEKPAAKRSERQEYDPSEAGENPAIHETSESD